MDQTWEFLQYDLGSAANNMPGIRFRFRYATNGNSNNKIFRIDDFIVGINYDLPIELQSFEAVAVPGRRTVDLRWTTASEKDNAYFEIERSSDEGRQYEMIGAVPGAGSTTVAQTYVFEDRSAPCGTPLYRLRQEDFDQSSSYSPVRVVRMPCSGFRIQPTLATDLLQIIWNEDDAPAAGARWQIIGQTGKVVREGVFAEESVGAVTVAVSDLPDGLYYLKVRTDRNTETLVFYKQ